MPINGMATVEAARATGGFPNNPEFDKGLEFEMRQGSIWGQLARPRPGVTTGLLGIGRGGDVAATNAVMKKTISKGDEADFSMVKNLDGSPVFGDVAPETGEYLDFWFKKLRINAISSPAYPLQSRMNLQRLMNAIPGSVEAQLKSRILDWNADQYVIDCYRGFLRGASDNVLAAKAEGGLNQDLGRGAGTQVSPLNVIALGTGALQAKEAASLAAHESALKTAITNLDVTDADFLLTYDALQRIGGYMHNFNIKGIGTGGDEKFVMVMSPSAFHNLTKYDSQLQKLYSASDKRDKSNPAFGFQWLDVGPFMIYVDPWITKFYPDISGSDIVWGTSSRNPRNFKPTGTQAKAGIALVLGAGALMEATNGAVSIDEAKDDFGRNFKYSSYAIRAHMRSMWKPEDGSSELPIDQSGALVCFADPGFDFADN